MKPISCLLIDDERLARQEMKALLSETEGFQVVGGANNVAKALKLIRQTKPQVLFLDINMPGQNGFDLLSELENCPIVVFVTAYHQYAIQAFEVRAFDYLLKPVNSERFKATVASIQQKLLHDPPVLKRLFIKQGDAGFFLDLADVFLIRAYGHYIRIYYNNSTCIIHRSLSAFTAQLDKNQFMRINRSEVVQLAKVITSCTISRSRYALSLPTGIKVEVSESRSQELRKRFMA